MTNIEATYIYRAAIAQAIRVYNARLHMLSVLFADNTDARRDGMIDAWGTCRVMFALADIMLEKHRLQSRANASRDVGLTLVQL
jgi:head-tail adaptor